MTADEDTRPAADDPKPPNYARSVFHVSSGLVALVSIMHLATPTGLIWIASLFAGTCWVLEFLRKRSPSLNAKLMVVFGPMARQHEYTEVNSATWYASALVILAVFGSQLTCALAVMVLAVGDPFAGLIGRRFGRTKIRAGRSLEGSLAFVVAGAVTAFALMVGYFPALGIGRSLLIAAACGVAGSVAELFSQKLDDNFTIPVAVGAAVAVMTWLLG